jgi:hypothetical protein
VIAKEPLHCDGVRGEVGLGLPQFETDKTYVGLIQVKPRGRVVIGRSAGATLVVALDTGSTHSGENGAVKPVHSGDFVWLDKGKSGEAFENETATEVRLVCFALTRVDGPSSTSK